MRTSVPYPLCPYCEGYLPTVWRTKSRGHHIKYPHPGLLCRCGFWQEHRKRLPEELGKAKVRFWSGVFGPSWEARPDQLDAAERGGGDPPF